MFNQSNPDKVVKAFHKTECETFALQDASKVLEGVKHRFE
jgi:hypothetical protein